VIAGQQPFPRANAATVIYKVVTGKLPDRPLGPNEWLSDDIWNLISRCLSQSLDGRPDISFATNALNDVVDAVRIAFMNTLTQLTSVGMGSRESQNTLTKILASQEGVNAAMSLRGDDVLTLVDTLDQVRRQRVI